MGGRSPLRILVQGSPDLVDTVFATDEGGHKLDEGLAGMVRDAHAGAFRAEMLLGPGARSDLLLEELRTFGEGPPDIMALSFQLDVEGPLGAEEFRESLTRLIDSAKERWGAHVLVLGASSVDPDDFAHNYHGRGDSLALRIHRFNLAMFEVAMRSGISIIDADRILAELGAARHVRAPFDYSREAHRALLEELHRVIGDIGFFEARPLLPQVGRA